MWIENVKEGTGAFLKRDKGKNLCSWNVFLSVLLSDIFLSVISVYQTVYTCLTHRIANTFCLPPLHFLHSRYDIRFTMLFLPILPNKTFVLVSDEGKNFTVRSDHVRFNNSEIYYYVTKKSNPNNFILISWNQVHI